MKLPFLFYKVVYWMWHFARSSAELGFQDARCQFILIVWNIPISWQVTTLGNLTLLPIPASNELNNPYVLALNYHRDPHFLVRKLTCWWGYATWNLYALPNLQLIYLSTVYESSLDLEWWPANTQPKRRREALCVVCNANFSCLKRKAAISIGIWTRR